MKELNAVEVEEVNGGLVMATVYIILVVMPMIIAAYQEK